MTLPKAHDKTLHNKFEKTNQNQADTETDSKMLICNPLATQQISE